MFCFTKVCEMEGIFDKNSFSLGPTLNVLKNFLLRVEREVQFPWEHPFFFVVYLRPVASNARLEC